MLKKLFLFIDRAWLTQSALNDVYVPMTTNGLQMLNGGGYLIQGDYPGLVSRPLDSNPNARALNTVSRGNQIPGFFVSQGLIQNKPGQNF